LVRKQLEHRIEDQRQRLKNQGFSNEAIEKRSKEMHAELSTLVEREVKVYLILDKIASVENIEVKEGENLPAKVIEFLLKEAKWEEIAV
jgi:FKBP-type peptidyl-prolyl cis-trans isomerase (trigger factor)